MKDTYGLYILETEDEEAEIEEAVETLELLLSTFIRDMQEWRSQYRSLGAEDSAVREEIWAALACDW